MIDVYFIRHGETGGNVAKRHQQENTHLTPLGKEQARVVAAMVAKVQPTHLFVSHRVRALETGQAIAAATDLTPEVSDLFNEICRPHNMYGHHHRSVKTVWYLWQWWCGQIGADDCGSEGESYAAFRARLTQAKDYLATLPDDARVVVVSHSVFISMFLAHLYSSKPLSFFGAIKTFLRIRSMSNGHMVRVSYTAGRWSQR